VTFSDFPETFQKYVSRPRLQDWDYIPDMYPKSGLKLGILYHKYGVHSVV